MTSTKKYFITGIGIVIVIVCAFGGVRTIYGNPAPLLNYKTVLLSGVPSTGSADEQRAWFEKWLNSPENKGWRFVQLVPSNGQNMPFKAPMVVMEKLN